MHKVWLIVLLCGGWASAQEPGGPPAVIASDPTLSAALAGAWRSGLPHRELLAQQIETLAALSAYTDEAQFKAGARSVLRHSDFSQDRLLGELYLRVVQRPTRDQVLASFRVAATLVVDGNRKDWPRDAVISFPKQERIAAAAGATESPLKSFGAIRGSDSLFVWLESREKFESLPKHLFGIEVARLSDRFNSVAYTVNVQGRQVRFYNGAGEEFSIQEDQPITARRSSRAMELRIPLQRFESNLRSVAVRGFILDPRSPDQVFRTPWTPCPSGPAFEPTGMLVHFAAGRELPAGAGSALAVALQEGLLLSRSHADLGARIQSDAFAWMELALDIEQRLEFQGRPPVHRMPVAAQLAWAARYTGDAGFETVEEYEANVVLPQTVANMRGYAEVQGWLKQDVESVVGAIAGLLAKFKTYDYPDAAAWESGADYTDKRSNAYYVKGDTRLLSYRDVGINLRWQLFEEGFGLKGTPAQAVEFQRLLATAVGLPSLAVRHQDAKGTAAYTVVYDARKRRWLAVGAPQLVMTPKAKVHFIWDKPWTRPERFPFWEDRVHWLPTGPIRRFLTSDCEEMSVKRLDSLLNRGIANDLFTDSILQPL